MKNHLLALNTFEERAAIDETSVARGGPRFCAGLSATWAAAERHRVDLIVVEETFAVRAKGHLTMMSNARDRVSGKATDDLVDELIEAVLDGGGRVQPVKDGSLPEAWCRVAAKLRH